MSTYNGRPEGRRELNTFDAAPDPRVPTSLDQLVADGFDMEDAGIDDAPPDVRALVVEQAVAMLSPADQEVYDRLYVQQLSIREAAGSLEATRSGVHRAKQRIERAVRDALALAFDEEGS